MSLLVALSAIVFAQTSVAETALLVVYSDHFELDARRLETVAEVRTALRGREVAVLLQGCDAEAKVLEIQPLLDELAQTGRLSPVAAAHTPAQCGKGQ